MVNKFFVFLYFLTSFYLEYTYGHLKNVSKITTSDPNIRSYNPYSLWEVYGLFNVPFYPLQRGFRRPNLWFIVLVRED